MEVVDGAIDEFGAVLEFFEDWKTSKLGRSEFENSENCEIFQGILRRYVGITRKLAINLYDQFDLYIVEKNRNPLLIKRFDGQKDKKVRFGSRKYKLDVQTTLNDELPLFHVIVGSLTVEELTIINTLYSATLKLCRLILFMRDIKDDKPAEKGEQLVIEITNSPGKIVRGLLTFSPNASTEKEIETYLNVTDSCKNLSGVEVYHADEVTFGLKLILAKLKRIRHPYVTAIQSVEKLDEIHVKAAENWAPKNLQDLSAGDTEKYCDIKHQELNSKFNSNSGGGDLAESGESDGEKVNLGECASFAACERSETSCNEEERLELQTGSQQKFEDIGSSSGEGLELRKTIPTDSLGKTVDKSEVQSAEEITTASDAGFRLIDQCALQ